MSIADKTPAIVLCAVLGLALAGGAAAEIPLERGEFDPTPFDTQLKEYVTEDGRVDYSAWKAKGLEDLDAFLDAAAGYDLHSTMGKEPRAAFLVNAYNAWAIRQVLEHYPVASVSEIPGFFDKNSRKIAGEDRTLDGIEATLAEILPHVPAFAIALSPATIGGPKLSRNAFYGQDFEKLLAERLSVYISKDRRVRVDPDANILYLTPRIERHMELYEALPKGMGEAFSSALPLKELVALNFKNPEHVVEPEDARLNDVATEADPPGSEANKDR